MVLGADAIVGAGIDSAAADELNLGLVANIEISSSGTCQSQLLDQRGMFLGHGEESSVSTDVDKLRKTKSKPTEERKDGTCLRKSGTKRLGGW